MRADKGDAESERQYQIEKTQKKKLEDERNIFAGRCH